MRFGRLVLKCCTFLIMHVGGCSGEEGGGGKSICDVTGQGGMGMVSPWMG